MTPDEREYLECKRRKYAGLTFDDMCAILIRDPFRMTFDQIQRLTDYQIKEIVFRETDEHGRVQLKGVSSAPAALSDPYAIFVHSCRLRLKEDGTPFTDEEIAALWIEEQKQQAIAAEKHATGGEPGMAPVVGPVVNGGGDDGWGGATHD